MHSDPSPELTDDQIDQLQEFLASIDGAMGLEEVDGLYCALISGPDIVMPSEYWPEIFGGEMPEFETEKQANDIIGLLSQHWNHIADTLFRDEIYCPVLFGDDSGKVQGNDFAHGYMRGVGMRRQSWADLIEDEENGGLMIPVMAFYFEHDDDPELRPGPFDDDKREDLLTHMIASILKIYRYLEPARRREMQQPIQRKQPKIGRNDPCYCGSGKKFKHCHGAVTLH